MVSDNRSCLPLAVYKIAPYTTITARTHRSSLATTSHARASQQELPTNSCNARIRARHASSPSTTNNLHSNESAIDVVTANNFLAFMLTDHEDAQVTDVAARERRNSIAARRRLSHSTEDIDIPGASGGTLSLSLRQPPSRRIIQHTVPSQHEYSRSGCAKISLPRTQLQSREHCSVTRKRTSEHLREIVDKLMPAGASPRQQGECRLGVSKTVVQTEENGSTRHCAYSTSEVKHLVAMSTPPRDANDEDLEQIEFISPADIKFRLRSARPTSSLSPASQTGAQSLRSLVEAQFGAPKLNAAGQHQSADKIQPSSWERSSSSTTTSLSCGTEMSLSCVDVPLFAPSPLKVCSKSRTHDTTIPLIDPVPILPASLRPAAPRARFDDGDTWQSSAKSYLTRLEDEL